MHIHALLKNVCQKLKALAMFSNVLAYHYPTNKRRLILLGGEIKLWCKNFYSQKKNQVNGRPHGTNPASSYNIIQADLQNVMPGRRCFGRCRKY